MRDSRKKLDLEKYPFCHYDKTARCLYREHIKRGEPEIPDKAYCLICINTQIIEHINSIYHLEQFVLFPGGMIVRRNVAWDGIRMQLDMLAEWIIKAFPERAKEIGEKNKAVFESFQKQLIESSSRYTT